MDEIQLKEQYCKLHGYEKLKGIKIDVDRIDSDFSYMYLPYGEEDDIVTMDVFFWMDKEGNNEDVYEDIDDLIEYIEDSLEGTAPDFNMYKKTVEGEK